MSETITLKLEEIFRQVQLSLEIPTVVEAALSRRIIDQAAATECIEASLEELQQTADDIRLASQLQSADATWSWLERHHLSLEDLEEISRNIIISQKLAEHLFAAKVPAFFAEHQLDYRQAVIYEIILEDSDLAMELFYALQEGEMSFPVVAHQYCQEAEQRRRGGYRGTLSREMLKPELVAAVFAASPPQVLKPILTAQGVHLILVEELIMPKLDKALRDEILEDLFAEWLRLQLEPLEATISIPENRLESRS